MKGSESASPVTASAAPKKEYRKPQLLPGRLWGFGANGVGEGFIEAEVGQQTGSAQQFDSGGHSSFF